MSSCPLICKEGGRFDKCIYSDWSSVDAEARSVKLKICSHLRGVCDETSVIEDGRGEVIKLQMPPRRNGLHHSLDYYLFLNFT